MPRQLLFLQPRAAQVGIVLASVVCGYYKLQPKAYTSLEFQEEVCHGLSEGLKECNNVYFFLIKDNNLLVLYIVRNLLDKWQMGFNTEKCHVINLKRV